MKIDTDITIARPAEQVWAILGDLAGVTRWVPGISSARMEGSRRICLLEDGGEIHEEISDYSDEQRRYAYTQPVHPLGFERSQGTLAVEANGGGASRVVWNAEVVTAKPGADQILEMLRQGYAAALQRLKDVAEKRRVG
jgi:protein-tyrosine phosphatase